MRIEKVYSLYTYSQYMIYVNSKCWWIFKVSVTIEKRGFGEKITKRQYNLSEEN